MKRLVMIMTLLMLVVGMGHAQSNGKLVKVDETAFDDHAKIIKQDGYDYKDLWAKEAFRNYCNDPEQLVNFTEADYRQLRDSVDQYYKLALAASGDLTSEKIRLENIIAKNSRTIDSLQNEVIIPLQESAKGGSALASQNSALNDRVLELEKDLAARDEEIEKLKKNANAIEAYRAVFKSTEETIDGIYDANKDRLVREMSMDEFARANATFVSMEPLLQTDEDLYATLKDKVDEMETWKSLRTALDEGLAYMQEKFNNTKRQQCLTAINIAMGKAKLSDTQRTNVQEIAEALANQAEVQKKFSDMMVDLIDDVYVLETSKTAEKVLNKIAATEKALDGKLSVYHIKHNEALAVMRDLFSQATKDISKNRMNTPNGFEKAINDIKKIYQ